MTVSKIFCVFSSSAKSHRYLLTLSENQAMRMVRKNCLGISTRPLFLSVPADKEQQYYFG